MDRSVPVALGVLAATGCWVHPLLAQGPWDAILSIDPIPSPYLSDWEANPNISTLTVFNGTGRAESVRLVFEVVDGGGRLLAHGASEAQLIPGDAPTIFDSPFDLAGSTQHDTEVERQMRRTGRLPEGDFRACVAVADLGGFQLAEVCESFSIVYPDPPMLVAPFDGEELSSQNLFFQWTPSQVPFGFDLRYVLQIAEIRSGQLPSEALQSNILHFHEEFAGSPQLQYPLYAQPLEAGKRYAWRVQALDVNGFPVAANNGSSEIWTFTFDDGSGAGPRRLPADGAPATFEVQMRGRDAGDVADGPDDEDGAFISTSMAALCATSDDWAEGTVDPVLRTTIDAPFFGSDAFVAAVQFAVDTVWTQERQVWAIHGRSTTRAWEYFARGDCEGLADDPGLLGSLARIHMIAARPVDRSMNDFLDAAFGADQDETASEDPYEAHAGFELDYGVGILALRSLEVGKGHRFPTEKDFFGGHEFEVLPGLNAFGVVHLPERSVWAFLRDWGFDQNKFEIQGFLGLSNQVSASAGFGSEGAGGELTLEQKFFELRVAFPSRTPRIDWIRSMNAGIMWSVVAEEEGGGTLTWSEARAKARAGFKHQARLTWTWVINDDVEIQWAGGLDAGAQWSTGQALGADIKVVLSGACDCRWDPAFGLGQWWIGDPKLELTMDYFSTIPELELKGTFRSGWADLPESTAGLSLKWRKGADNMESPLRETFDTMWGARDAHFDAIDRVEALEAEGASAEDLAEAREASRKATSLYEALRGEVDRLAADPSTPAIEMRWNWNQPQWKISFGVGGVGVMQVLDAVRSLR